MFSAGIAMVQLLGIIGILCCGQVVCSQHMPYVSANMTQARAICDANGLVLPSSSDDNLLIAQRLQQANISETWIDLTISPSSWNWITDDEYTVHYDQGCYNLSSLPIQPMANDINTCRESCSCYVYVGVQAISEDNISCVCTNETEISSAVQEFDCSSACNVTSNSLLCGNKNLETFRLLSTRELSSLSTREVTWYDKPDLNIGLPFLCASLLILAQCIKLLPQDCTTQLPAICELNNGTVTSLHSVSWFRARQLCREHGMKSVRVSSPNQTNILAANIEEGWTALRGWSWRSQGHEICDTIPSNWSDDYPKKSEGDCIVVLKNGSWKNVHCDAENTFLCESSNTSSPAECRSSSFSTSANTSCLTTTMEASTTSEPHRDTSSDPHKNAYSDPQNPTTSQTEVTNTTPATDHLTTDDEHTSNTASSLGVTGVAVGAVIAFLVLAAVVVTVIVLLRKRKQASSGGSSPQTQCDPSDDKSLRPECDQSMDELPIYASPNKDPLTDGVILVVDNSLYGSVDLDDDELPSSRRVTAASANVRGQGTAVYELAMASMVDEVNDDSTSGPEAGDLSGSDSSMKDQVPDDDPLMIDNSLYDSTDSAMDGIPVP